MSDLALAFNELNRLAQIAANLQRRVDAHDKILAAIRDELPRESQRRLAHLFNPPEVFNPHEGSR
jgi:hypothetical protein